MKSVWTNFITHSKTYSVFKVVNDLRVKNCNYIVVKGYDWFIERLDAIGYSPLPYERTRLMKAIWTNAVEPNEHIHDYSNKLLKEIIGNGKESRKDTVYK